MEISNKKRETGNPKTENWKLKIPPALLPKSACNPPASPWSAAVDAACWQTPQISLQDPPSSRGRQISPINIILCKQCRTKKNVKISPINIIVHTPTSCTTYGEITVRKNNQNMGYQSLIGRHWLINSYSIIREPEVIIFCRTPLNTTGGSILRPNPLQNTHT